MTLDYLQVHQQVQMLGVTASQRQQRLQRLRQQAQELLKANASDPGRLASKVELIASRYDPRLRCARPVPFPYGDYQTLDCSSALPPEPHQATIVAADGSQINPDRHAAINFGLINIGSIEMHHGSDQAPKIDLLSQLLTEEELYAGEGTISEAQLALKRDLRERGQLLKLAKGAIPPVITFTDGPMELWGGREAETSQEFLKSLEEYRQVLQELKNLGAATAGYVDKPASNLVVRLLEVACLEEDQLQQAREHMPLRGVLDRDLFRDLLAPGERSAIFAIQSSTAQEYPGTLALHFFYLNVGSDGHPWPVRVEVPSWVASDSGMLDNLHAILVHQCRVLGNRPYPYLLHRAHEAALVSWNDRQQVASMLERELLNRGLEAGDLSQKQALKDLKR